MRDLREQNFYHRLLPQFQKKLPELMNQAKIVYIYSKLEFATYVFAGGLLLVNYKEFFSGNFSQNAFTMIMAGGITIAVVNHMSKEPKEKLKKTSEKIKNNIIIKVCRCDGYCTCKEEFVNYMNSRNIKILG